MAGCQFEAMMKELEELTDSKSVANAKGIEGLKALVSTKSVQPDIRSAIVAVNKGKPAEKHTAKELKKVEQATQYIGFGTPNSSTGRYAKVYGAAANTGNYAASDVIWVSSNGARGGRVNPVINGELANGFEILDKAIEVGSTIVMDTEAHINNTKNYNIGEVALAKYITNKGYTRDTTSGAGVWTKTVPIESNTPEWELNLNEVEAWFNEYIDETTNGLRNRAARNESQASITRSEVGISNEEVKRLREVFTKYKVARVKYAYSPGKLLELKKYQEYVAEIKEFQTNVMEVVGRNDPEIEAPNRRVKGSDPESEIEAPGKASTDEVHDNITIDPKEDIAEMFMEFYSEDSREIQSREFADLQNETMAAYTDMAKAINMDTIKIDVFTNAVLETAGQANLNDNSMRIRWNSMSRTASQSEIFMHELGHIIAKDVFKSDVDLRGVTEDLRDAALAQGIDYNVFLKGIENPNGMEIEVAKRKFEYVFYGDLEEFYAYVTSNENVYDAVKDVEIKAELIARIQGNGKPTKFLNKLIDAVNNVWLKLTGRGGKTTNAAGQRVNIKGNKVVANLVATVARVGAELDSKKSLETEEEMGGDPSVWEIAKRHGDNINEKMKTQVERKTEIMEAIKNKGKDPFKRLEATLGKIGPINAALETGAMSYLYNTVTGDTTTKDVTAMYQVFRKVKNFVEKHTNDIRHALSQEIAALYVGDDKKNPIVDKSTQRAVKAVVIDTDLNQIEDIQEVKKLLDDPQYLEMKINEVKADIEKDYKVLAQPGIDYNTRLKQIDGLAHYMVHGQTIVHNQQMNASNIVVGFDVGFQTEATTSADGTSIPPRSKKVQTAARAARGKNADLVGKVDRLTTLLAIKKSSNRDKMLVGNLIGKDADLVSKTSLMYKNYLTDMRNNAKVGTYDPVRKGYSKAEEGNIKYRLVPESEIESQLVVNMKLVDDQYEHKFLRRDRVGVKKRLAGVKPYAIVGGVKYYMMTGRVRSTGFSEGAIGLISNTAEGVTLSSLVNKNNEMKNGDGALTGKNAADLKKLIATVAKTGRAPGFELVAGTTMVPVYDHTGSVVDYRLQMTTVQKEMELDEGNELGEVLSNTFSRSTKTELTKKYNEVVIDTIIEHTGQGIEENPDDYVIVEEYTEQDRHDGVKREKRHDRWDNLPDYTKDYIFKKINFKGISIHKDFVELMTGEKDLTVGNLRVGNFDIHKKPKLRAGLMALEGYTKEVLGHMKRVMILLNAAIVTGNILSNATVAAIHGVSPIDYATGMKEEWKLLNEYNELNRRKAELEVKSKAGQDMTSRIKALDVRIKAHDYHSLANDGQFTPIADDVNVDEKESGVLAGMLQDAIDGKGKYEVEDGDSEAVIARKKKKRETHDKFAGVVNAVKNVLYIDKASKFGRFALKNTQYQDVMTRRMIQKKMEKKAETKFLKAFTVEQVALKASKLEGKEYKQRLHQLEVKYSKLRKAETRNILDYLDQLLVNYGYTMNRYWAYAEKVLGLLFLRYYFGQAKALASMTAKNPLGVLIAEGGQGVTGVDISDPFETYLKTPLEAMTTRMMLGDAIPEIITPNIGDVFSL